MATYARPYSETSGTIAFASAANRYVDDFVSTVNALNSQNIIASGVGAGNMKSSAVVNRAINDGAVDADKVDGELRLYQEVFG